MIKVPWGIFFFVCIGHKMDSKIGSVSKTGHRLSILAKTSQNVPFWLQIGFADSKNNISTYNSPHFPGYKHKNVFKYVL